MANFVNFMGSWTHETLAESLAHYHNARERLSELDTFLELTRKVLSHAQSLGDSHALETLDLISDVLTKYVYVGDDCFGRTTEVFDLILDIDTFLFEANLGTNASHTKGEIAMKTTLLKDTNGNLYAYVGYDADTRLHEVLDVEENNGEYVCTQRTWYFTDCELAEMTEICVDVDA